MRQDRVGWHFGFCRKWRDTATIGWAGVGDDFLGRMLEQIKADPEEDTDDRSADESDAEEVENDANPKPQFGASAGRGRQGCRHAALRRCGAGPVRVFIKRGAYKNLAGHLPTPSLGR